MISAIVTCFFVLRPRQPQDFTGSWSHLKGDASALVQALPDFSPWYMQNAFYADPLMGCGEYWSNRSLTNSSFPHVPSELICAVKLGPHAIPILCRHLVDQTMTGLILNQTGF